MLDDTTWEKSNVLTKPKLMVLAKYLNFDVKHAMLKKDIKIRCIEPLEKAFKRLQIDVKIKLEEKETRESLEIFKLPKFGSLEGKERV